MPPEDWTRQVLQLGTAAAQAWRRAGAAKRARVLMDAASRLEERTEAFATLIARDADATAEEARAEVGQAVDALRLCAGECTRICGQIVPDPAPETASRAFLQPKGLCVAFTDFAWPLLGPARIYAAALAAGSAVIVSAEVESVRTATALADVLASSGAGDAALCVERGSQDDVLALAGSPAVRDVHCEGNADFVRLVMAARAEAAVPATCQVEGAAPAVVCADADVRLAAREIAENAFSRGGAPMEAIRRVYVARPLLDAFLAAVCAFAEARPPLRIRRPHDAEAFGERLSGAKGNGLRLAVGGAQDRPAVLWGSAEAVAKAARPLRAPLLLIAAYDDLTEAVALANSPSPGIAAYVFTRDLTVSHRLCTDIDAQHIAVNQREPFTSALPGGAHGIGLVQPLGSVGEYMTTKHIRMSYL